MRNVFFLPPYTRLFLLGLIWGANFLFMKVALASLSPDQAVWLRLAFGAAALAPFLPSAARAVRQRPALLAHSAAMSLFANIVTFKCFMEGSQRLDSGVAGAVSGSIPLATALLAALVLAGERLTKRKGAGLLLGACGIAVLTEPWRAGGPPNLAGTGFMLAGALGYAAAFVYAKRFLTDTHADPAGLAALQMLAATVFYAPFVPWGGMEVAFSDWKLFADVALGLGALGSGLAYVMYYGLVRDLGAVAASSVTYLPPMVAMGLGSLFLGEPFTSLKFFGVLLILAGIFLLRRR